MEELFETYRPLLFSIAYRMLGSAMEARGLAFKGTDGSDSCLTFTDPDGHWFQLVNPDAH